MKRGIYVGTFDPPHLGHLKLVEDLLAQKVVDKIEIVPTLAYWDKVNITPLAKRIEMLELVKKENIIVNKEFNRLKYTYEVMRAFKEKYPRDNLYLIMGADNIVNFSKWQNYEELLNYNLIIVNRNNIDINKYLQNYPNKDNFIIFASMIPHISSTMIRQKFKEQKLDDLDQYLDQKVINYINNYKLYS